MVFLRFFRWLANIFGPAKPAITSSGSINVPSSNPFTKMANTMKTLQAVKPHVPLIKFPRERPQPNYLAVLTGAQSNSQENPTRAVDSSPAHVSSNKPAIGSTPRGSGIDERLLPPNLRRRLLTDEEVEIFNEKQCHRCNESSSSSSSMEQNVDTYVEQCRALCRSCKTEPEAAVKIAAGLVEKCRQVSATKCSTLNELWAELESENKQLLSEFMSCFENCKNNQSLAIFLLRFLDIFINRSTKGRNSRLRLVARVNGAQMVLKCLLPFLQIEHFNVDVVEPLIYLLLLIGGVDKKIHLKMRLTGLLKAASDVLCQQTCPPSLGLLDLLTVAAQSPLNAVTLGKQAELIPSLVRVLKNSNSNLSTQNTELTRKCLELAYYIGKTKKNRQKMVAGGFIPVALDVFRLHFEHRSETQSMKLCLVSLGLLRLLARTKTGREELLSANGLSTFKNAVKTSLESAQSNVIMKELDAAVCSVCLRCLPPKSLPVEKLESSLTFVLPQGEDCRRPAEDNSDSDDDNTEPPPISETEEEEPLGDESLGDDPNAKRSRSGSINAELESYRKFCSEYNTMTDFAANAEVVGQKLHKRSSSAVGLDGSSSAYVRVKSESDLIKLSKRNSRHSGADPHPESIFVKGKKVEDTGFISVVVDAQVNSDLPSIGQQLQKYQIYDRRDYVEQTKETKSLMKFCKIAFPDYVCGYPDLPLQPLKEFPNALLQRVLGELEKCNKICDFESRTIFDLDELMKTDQDFDDIKCNDEDRAGIADSSSDHLKFESRFESGNLRKVIQVGPLEYELILSSDINQLLHHYQWFYFEVSNMQQDVPYVFKIVNMVKSQSLFSTGMQPVIFSVMEAKCGRPGWARCGQSVVYYRNSYIRPQNTVRSDRKQTETRSFYTASFTVSFRHSNDVCYVAYHYPYTYSSLKANLLKWQQMVSTKSNIYFKKDVLANSLGGNAVHLLTITAAPIDNNNEQILKRDVIFLTSRVHPGEANASWMMHGTVRFLLSDHPLAQQAREIFVFKIVPMLNPDGVINGNHRCSLSGQDLNRQWAEPLARLHPSIYHTKNLLLYLHNQKKTPLVFCDYHGHSRKKNVFVYGNNPALSWWPNDVSLKHDYEFYTLPEILNEFAPCFSLKYCSFQIQKGKESSARVNVWRQMGIQRSYTMEASYGGFDRGRYAGYQIGTRESIEMGERFVECLVVLKEYIDSNRLPSKKFENTDDDSEHSSSPAKEV